MKKAIAEKWATALEKGKLKQNFRWLFDGKDKSYCALGVLVEMYEREHPKNRVTTNVGDTGEILILFSQFQEENMEKFLSWAGFISENPSFEGQSISNMNDVQKKSFKEIADFIRKNYKKIK